MHNQRFWIVGGEYRSLDFDDVIDGTQQVIGPLPTRAAAEAKWRELSERHRGSATTRFGIACEAVSLS